MDILLGIAAVIVALVLLGAVLQVVRAVLWSVAFLLLVFLVWVGWREYQHTRSLGAAFRASGRTLARMARQVGDWFRRP